MALNPSNSSNLEHMALKRLTLSECQQKITTEDELLWELERVITNQT